MPHAQQAGQTTTTTKKKSLVTVHRFADIGTEKCNLPLSTPSTTTTATATTSSPSPTTGLAANDTSENKSNHTDQDMGTEKVDLKLCLYGGKEATVERSFSGTTTLDEIQQEMRKVFNVGPSKEAKLWINSNVYTFKSNLGDENGDDGTNASSETNEAKENNSLATSNSSPINNVTSTTNSIKPPPTPPPMPSSSSGASNDDENNQGFVKFTRQMSITKKITTTTSNGKPIALPDSSSIISSSTSPVDESHQDSSKRTLSEVGVSSSAVVTLEIVNEDGTWPSSRPRYGTVTTRSSRAQPGLCGLSNMGNTCFMNSALQCLSNTPPLTNYILTDKFVDDINTSNPLGMHGEIARTYAELIKVMWSGNNTSFLPREFKCAVSRFAPQFTGFAQQDCQELMAFLLDGLHEDLNRIKNKPYIEIKNDVERRPDEEVARESWENYKKRNDSIVVDTFHAMLKSTLVCPECQLVSVTFDPFCYLSLPLPVKREKQVNLTFFYAPVCKIDESKINSALNVLDPEDVKIIKQFGGKISSFDGDVEKHAGYYDHKYRPRGCKIQVPRSGPASELCEIVARIFNMERSADMPKVKPENLVVAELAAGRISKIYESSEHYNQISDDVVVIEKASKYVVPLYLRERATESMCGMSNLYFVHTDDLKYETLYKIIISSLSNLTCDQVEEVRKWCPLTPPATLDDQMDCDDDEDRDNVAMEEGDEIVEKAPGPQYHKVYIHSLAEDAPCGTSKSVPQSSTSSTSTSSSPKQHKVAFDLNIVNSYGNHPLERLGPNTKESDYSSKLYLGATFSTEFATSAQFVHNRKNVSQSIEYFTPKIVPKPTLQLKDCISQFVNAERLGTDDPWYCPKCKKHQQAFKKFDVWSLPKVLIIHLKRFSFSRSWRDKIDTYVEFPVEGLDMSSYVHNPEQKEKSQLVYNLIGVANHFGGLGGGHYTAYAKNAHLDAWYSFDDALVTQTSANNVVTRSAYVLFYQLQEDQQQQQQ